MKSIKLYAKHLKRLKAQHAILEDLKEGVLRELKRIEGGKVVLDGVEFHRTVKTTRRYPKDIQDIIRDLQEQIDQQKKVAEEASKVKVTKTETFDAAIPKSGLAEALTEVTDYRKHFGG